MWNDSTALWKLLPDTYQATILEDKGYIGDKLTSDLKYMGNITLLALKRKNSKVPYPKELIN